MKECHRPVYISVGWNAPAEGACCDDYPRCARLPFPSNAAIAGEPAPLEARPMIEEARIVVSSFQPSVGEAGIAPGERGLQPCSLRNVGTRPSPHSASH